MDVNISRQKFINFLNTVSFSKSATVIPFLIQMSMSTPNEGIGHCMSLDAHPAENVF